MRYQSVPPEDFDIPEFVCTHCEGSDGHWELIYTGDQESRNGWEFWFCCHPCRDKGEPCETFIPIK